MDQSDASRYIGLALEVADLKVALVNLTDEKNQLLEETLRLTNELEALKKTSKK